MENSMPNCCGMFRRPLQGSPSNLLLHITSQAFADGSGERERENPVRCSTKVTRDHIFTRDYSQKSCKSSQLLSARRVRVIRPVC